MFGIPQPILMLQQLQKGLLHHIAGLLPAAGLHQSNPVEHVTVCSYNLLQLLCIHRIYSFFPGIHKIPLIKKQINGPESYKIFVFF